MAELLPHDWNEATLVGRIDLGEGPLPIVITRGRVLDVSRTAATVADLLDSWSGTVRGTDMGALQDLRLRPAWEQPAGGARLLSPIDLQCIKAAGVTFAVSALERVIEERARGDAEKAHAIREELKEKVGTDLASVKPGSPQAACLKEALMGAQLWSQYLEVAIGPDAEIFTKCAPLSTVGWGDYIGIRSDSSWNNPEPEVVMVCDSGGRALGATLGNDVNLRDFEGRSALLLSKAKDNNASCSLGPFVRMFDERFSLADISNATIELEIAGVDGFHLRGSSSMTQISRSPTELIRQAMSEHQYPDGMVLFLGTAFAPIQDRDAPGGGFTHKIGDTVRISSPRLGTLENQVTTSKAAPPWTFGVRSLMRNLAGRGLLLPTEAC